MSFIILGFSLITLMVGCYASKTNPNFYQNGDVNTENPSIQVIKEPLEINDTETVIEEEQDINDIPVVNTAMYYDQEDIVNMAKVLYRECGGVGSVTQQACVAWTVCNRADYSNEGISDAIKRKNQFAYDVNAPVTDDLMWLAEDVLSRWNREKNGETDVGRVLPKEYGYFYGDGKQNYFRDKFRGDYTIWDYSLESPYDC